MPLRRFRAAVDFYAFKRLNVHMIIGIVSHKGGVGKTTTAVHLAALLQRRGKTLLIDGDINRSALAWSRRGSLPFQVVDAIAAPRHAREAEHMVIDSAAHPSPADLEALVEGSDRLLVLTEPEAMSLDVLPAMLADLDRLKSDKHRVLITKVSPLSQAADVREMLEGLNVWTLKRHIRAYAAYRKAALMGVTVDRVTDDYAAEAFSDYQKVFREVMA